MLLWLGLASSCQYSNMGPESGSRTVVARRVCNLARVQNAMGWSGMVRDSLTASGGSGGQAGLGGTPGSALGMAGLVAGGGGPCTPGCCRVVDFVKGVRMSWKAWMVSICIVVGAAGALVMVV